MVGLSQMSFVSQLMFPGRFAYSEGHFSDMNSCDSDLQFSMKERMNVQRFWETLQFFVLRLRMSLHRSIPVQYYVTSVSLEADIEVEAVFWGRLQSLSHALSTIAWINCTSFIQITFT